MGVLLLTGTPMKNGKPSNLFPLLKAVRHPLGKHQMSYEKHFCNGMQKNFGRGRPVWDASGCSNLKQLKRLVTSNLLHLTKDQCLALPPLKREQYRVPISSRNQLQYIKAVKDLVSIQLVRTCRQKKVSHSNVDSDILSHVFDPISAATGEPSGGFQGETRFGRSSPWWNAKASKSLFLRKDWSYR